MARTARGQGQRRRSEARGRFAESVAAWWLRLKGYRILERRVRTRVGEVDLVARRGRCLVFVEVKYRATLAEAAEAAAQGQMARVRRSASLLAARYGHDWETVRIDAVLVAPWQLPRHLCAVAGEDGL
ncbi:YraN family protein [Pedomonas mirosovicensis]|uniref:YraN family protein n=1 Tax=Pedomonas mirosovicensis TaxID=2908641 RepID=UPI002167C15E|nr:YraN family protein [Pedomonas mirosovicensis]MCH8684567.1 YraN family protein [Pedomonas mirosovicensis]